MLDEIWVDNAPTVAQFKQQSTTSALAKVASLLVKPVEVRTTALSEISCTTFPHVINGANGSKFVGDPHTPSMDKYSSFS